MTTLKAALKKLIDTHALYYVDNQPNMSPQAFLSKEELYLIVAAVKPHVPEPQFIPVWEVRCIERTTSGGPCPGYLPHIAVRTLDLDANKLADQWRAMPNRDCVEIRTSKHLVSE